MSSTAQIDLGTVFQAMARLHKPEIEIPFPVQCLLDQVEKFNPAMQKVAEQAKQGVITPDSISEVFSAEVLGDPRQIAEKFLAVQTLAVFFKASIQIQDWPVKRAIEEAVPIPVVTPEKPVSKVEIPPPLTKGRKTWSRRKVEIPSDVLLQALNKHQGNLKAAGEGLARTMGRDRPVSLTAIENRIREYQLDRRWDGSKWVYSSKKETKESKPGDQAGESKEEG